MMTLIDLNLFYSKGKFSALDFGRGRTEKVHLSVAVMLSDTEMH